MERKIKTAAEYAEKSQAQLARDIDMTPSNFNQKLKRGTFTEEEFADMAKAMGAEFICKFRFPDGTEI
ncbi:XRE family transcriptional regulator [Desulfitobacterium hafniense]|nr:XRE family transcriptional regulator [Desulfitobacterium hafniense]